MTPHQNPIDLEELLVQIDGWFSDLSTHEPISHYARVRKKTPTATKLNTTKTNRKATLDSLAKDLELLLEKQESEENHQTSIAEPEIIYFNIRNNDEQALLDDSIGSCHVTYGETKDDDAMSWTDVSGGDQRSVIIQTNDENKSIVGQLKNSEKTTSNYHENDDLKIQTSTPLDHDYLSKPRAKYLNVDSQYLSSIRSKRMNISVLHTGVIKRFARFSTKFRELSLRNDLSLVVVNDGQ